MEATKLMVLASRLRRMREVPWAATCLLACMATACAPGETSTSSPLANRGEQPNGNESAEPEDPGEGPSGEQPKFEIERLVGDTAKMQTPVVDPLLVNPWGLASGPNTFWWIANNETNSSTLYDGEGAKQSLEVSVSGAPTGLVFNDSATGFVVSSGGASGTARFIFSAEDGTVSAWSPAVPPPAPSKTSSVVFTSPEAIYKGLAIAGDRIYVTDFHHARVDVLDSEWKTVALGADAFVDPGLPAGYAPFGVRALSGMIVVTYAKQDAAGEDDVQGAGLGYVDAFDNNGAFMFRIAGGGVLNAPWGLAVAPSEWGTFGGALLVGNFGDGRIHAYDLGSCKASGCTMLGALRGESGDLRIDGLWAIDFGKGNEMTGEKDELYFTAGPDDETHGLFGYIELEE